MRHPTFMEGYMLGDLHAEDIHDWVDQWHALQPSPCALHIYLGMTWFEYAEWVEAKDSAAVLKEIAQRRRAKPNWLVRAADRVVFWLLDRLLS